MLFYKLEAGEFEFAFLYSRIRSTLDLASSIRGNHWIPFLFFFFLLGKRGNHWILKLGSAKEIC